MSRIETVTNTHDWEKALRACEYNEILAAAFPVMDSETARGLLTLDENQSLAFDAAALEKTPLEEVLAVTGNRFEEVVDSSLLRLGRSVFAGNTGLHIDYYFKHSTSTPLTVWYGAHGITEATFIPLDDGEFPPDEHRYCTDIRDEKPALPNRILSRLDFTTQTNRTYDGIIMPEHDEILGAKRIILAAGTLLVHSAHPNRATKRRPNAHQFLEQSENRMGIAMNAELTFA